LRKHFRISAFPHFRISAFPHFRISFGKRKEWKMEAVDNPATSSSNWVARAIAYVALLALCAGATAIYLNSRGSLSAPEQKGASPPPPNPPDPTRDEVQFAPLIVSASQREHTFSLPIKNESDAVVEFTEIRKSCACAQAALRTKTLVPGDETILDVNVRLVGRMGPQRFSCELFTVGGRSWVREIVTTIYPQAEVIPPLLHFGALRVGEGRTVSLEIRCHAFEVGAIPRVVGVSTESKKLAVATPEETVESLPSGVWLRTVRYSIRLHPQSAAGFAFDRLRIKLDDGQEIEMSADWNVQSKYDISPSRLIFSDRYGAPATRTQEAAIRRIDGREISVKRLECPLPFAKATFARDGARAVIAIEMPSGKQQTQFGNLRVEVDDVEEPIILIPIVVDEPVAPRP
jgi:hypothetical protein